MPTSGKLAPIITGTRRLLLERLLESDANAVTLAQELKINISAIRNHLAGLELTGLVESRFERVTRGRPKRLYSLTPLARSFFPRKTFVVLSKLVQSLQKQLSQDDVIKLSQKVAQILWKDILTTKPSGKLQTRIETLVKALDAYGFYATRTETDRAHVIQLRNCVFQDLHIEPVSSFGKLIIEELRQIVERVIGEQLVEWQEPTEPGDHVVRVEIRKK